MDANPKKQGEFTGNAGSFKANSQRRIKPFESGQRIVNLLKNQYLFSQTFSLDTASPRS
jgi:hypothetical protein